MFEDGFSEGAALVNRCVFVDHSHGITSLLILKNCLKVICFGVKFGPPGLKIKKTIAKEHSSKSDDSKVELIMFNHTELLWLGYYCRFNPAAFIETQCKTQMIQTCHIARVNVPVLFFNIQPPCS